MNIFSETNLTYKQILVETQLSQLITNDVFDFVLHLQTVGALVSHRKKKSRGRHVVLVPFVGHYYVLINSPIFLLLIQITVSDQQGSPHEVFFFSIRYLSIIRF